MTETIRMLHEIVRQQLGINRAQLVHNALSVNAVRDLSETLTIIDRRVRALEELLGKIEGKTPGEAA